MINTNTNLLKEDYFESTYFVNKFQNSQKIINLDTQSLTDILLKRLNDIFQLDRKLDESDVTNLHNLVPRKYLKYDPHYGISGISNLLYDFDDDFNAVYKSIIKNQLRDQLDFDFYFQEIPTIRIHTPSPDANMFYPYFHSDIQLGHPPYEINIWFPLTRPSNDEGHGFVICSLEKSMSIYESYNLDTSQMNANKEVINELAKEDAKSVKCLPGEAIMFDSRCLHSAIPLRDHTRISIDVRIMPKKIFHNFNRVYAGTGRKKIKFIPGEAYSLNSSEI